jgi:hypothetical protein
VAHGAWVEIADIPSPREVRGGGSPLYRYIMPTCSQPHVAVVGGGGEMLDWEAPTGGYLLQAVFATALAVGRGVLQWLDHGAQD